MSDSRIAIRYAKPLLELAQQSNSLDSIKNDVELFAGVCKENRDFRLMLKNPIIKSNVKLGVIKKIFEGNVSDLSMKFFELLCKKNREAVLYPVALEVINEYNALKGIQSAELTTATAISPSQRDSFVNFVKAQTGKEAELTEKVDESILGGFVLNVNDLQVNASLTSRLKKLEVAFAQKN